MTLLTRWLLVFTWMGLIFFASSLPTLPSVPQNPLLDLIFKKSAHIVAYAILMVLVLRALPGADGSASLPRTLLALAIVLAFAASDEFHQSFVPGRTSLWTDAAVFDFTGACIGWVIWHRRKLSMGRSNIAWLYASLFLYCIALNVLLNLPFRGKAEQDASLLFTDKWFLWGFSYFGLLLTLVAALVIEDGARRGMKWFGYVIVYFVLGIVPLSLFMARRPNTQTTQTPLRFQFLLELRWLWWLMPLVTVAISLFWLPQGSLAQLIQTMSKNTGFWFMWLDIPLNQLVALPLLQADMRRRGVTRRTGWFIATLLTGPIGLGIYMATRPRFLAS